MTHSDGKPHHHLMQHSQLIQSQPRQCLSVRLRRLHAGESGDARLSLSISLPSTSDSASYSLIIIPALTHSFVQIQAHNPTNVSIFDILNRQIVEISEVTTNITLLSASTSSTIKTIVLSYFITLGIIKAFY